MIPLARDRLRTPAIQAAPLFVGLAVSTGHAAGIIGAVLMPALSLSAPTRFYAYRSALSYYAGALWPLIPGAKSFFGPDVSVLLALLLWATAVLVLPLPWLLFWSADVGQALWRAPLGLLFTVLPPLGIIGWASPLNAAGVLFPATAWCGVVGCAILTGALAVWPQKAAIIAIAISATVNLIHPTEPRSPPGWLAVDTRFGPIAHHAPDPLTEYQAAESIQQQALAARASVIVFPETVVPYWTAATDEFWQPTLARLKASGKTILVGARIPRALGVAPSQRRYDFSAELAVLRGAFTVRNPAQRKLPPEATWSPAYLNGIVVRGAHTMFYQQRVPVPIAMWNPFVSGAAPLRLFGPGVIRIANERAAILVCYEQMIAWPILTSMLQRPSVIVGVANDYWARGTAIARFQRTALWSWARLFGIPCLFSVNT